jgi:hypothetical protein
MTTSVELNSITHTNFKFVQDMQGPITHGYRSL